GVGRIAWAGAALRSSPCPRGTWTLERRSEVMMMRNRMRDMCTSGSVEQETHLVTPPRPPSEVPIIGFSALLQLVEWCHLHRQRSPHGGSSCVDPEPSLSPPAPDRSSPSSGPAPALVDVDRRIPTANPGHPQPN